MSHHISNTPKNLAWKSIDLSNENDMLKVGSGKSHILNTQRKVARPSMKKVPTFNQLVKNNPRLYDKNTKTDKNCHSHSHLQVSLDRSNH